MARSFEAIDALVRLAQDPVRNKHIAAPLIEWILLGFLYALGDLAILIVRYVERHSESIFGLDAGVTVFRMPSCLGLGSIACISGRCVVRNTAHPFPPNFEFVVVTVCDSHRGELILNYPAQFQTFLVQIYQQPTQFFSVIGR